MIMMMSIGDANMNYDDQDGLCQGTMMIMIIDVDEGDLQVSKGCNVMMMTMMMSIVVANINYDDQHEY